MAKAMKRKRNSGGMQSKKKRRISGGGKPQFEKHKRKFFASASKPASSKPTEPRNDAEDEDFPRGRGKTTLTAAEIQQAREEAEAEFSREMRKKLKQENAAVEEDSGAIIDSKPKKLSAGMRVSGAVSKIHVTGLSISFSNGLHGFVKAEEALPEIEEYKNIAKKEFKEKIHGLLEKYFKVGQPVSCIVLQVDEDAEKKRLVRLLLSLLPKRLNEGVTIDSIETGQLMVASVKTVEDHGYILSLGASKVSGFLLHKDNAGGKKFESGQIIQGPVLSLDRKRGVVHLSIKKSSSTPVKVEEKEEDDVIVKSTLAGAFVKSKTRREQVKQGEVVSGRIFKVLEGAGGLAVQLGQYSFGRVHVTHLGDSWLDNPAELFAEGMPVKCKVLEVKQGGKLHLSLRPSLGGSGGFESLPGFEQLRRGTSSLHIDSVKDLKRGLEVQAYVKSLTEKGCFLTLAPDVDARVLLKNLSDSYVGSVSEAFPKGKLVTARVLSVEPLSRRVELTMKSDVAPDHKAVSDFRVGDIVHGIIKSIQTYGIFVKIAGTDIDGLCHISEVSDDFIPDISKVFKAGQKVEAKVLKVDVATKRIALGLKSSYLDTRDDDVQEEEEEAQEEAEEEAEDVDDEQAEEAEETEQAVHEVNLVDASVEPLQVSFDDEEVVEPVVSDDEKPRPQETKKLSKKEKKRLKEQREAEIRAAEERLLQGDQPPETEDEFEKLVRASPNSSFVWIKYMAFWLRLADADKARAIAERALETINYREETEKMNIWTAYLNLENTYGSSPKENVAALFERALSFCDPKKLHLALLGIYEKSNHYELTDALMKSMTRKFKTSTKVWHRHLSNLLSRGLEDRARKAFDQALQGLPRHKHIKFISAAAILEFKSGSAERARDIFDGVLRNYPKRTDLWSVYIDQEIRLGDPAIIRDLFERATCLDLPPKKMKFLFKKYLEYEKSQGDDTRIEHVKTKAMEYVEGRAG